VILYYLDLVGVAVFAASGVLAARDRDLDVLGIVLVAAITAVGGGTLRDLLLDRHPIFWIADASYVVVIVVSALLAVAYLRVRQRPGTAFLVADALGLALFALSGAELAESAGCTPLIVVLMGTMTGVTGGVLRDVITARVPLLLQKEIYATAAIVGIGAYLALHAMGMAQAPAFWTGVLVVAVLRMVAIRWNLHLPSVRR
jgi:uncharacterized membrane protein YeiH